MMKFIRQGKILSPVSLHIIRRSHVKSPVDSSFYHNDLIVHESPIRGQAPNNGAALGFGRIFTDHMLEIDWTLDEGWGRPLIRPVQNFSLHPGAKVFHYATSLFEGVKAFRGVDDKVRIFRLDENTERMRNSAIRAALPEFDTKELHKLITELVRVDQDWVPRVKGASLYIRPTLMGTETCLGVMVPKVAKLFVIMSPVDRYYGNRDEGVTLLADPRYVRAFPGGVGAYKLACNYAPTIKISEEAANLGCNQVLWLFGEDKLLTEAGTMNIFVYWINEQGEKELLTPPLEDGLILPGVTRDTALKLAREWNECIVSEKYVSMGQIYTALKESRLLEVFGTGTAAAITPVSKILHRRSDMSLEELNLSTVWNSSNFTYKLLTTIRGIQRGSIEKAEWVTVV